MDLFSFITDARQILITEFFYEFRINSINDIKDALNHISGMDPRFISTAPNTITGGYYNLLKTVIQEYEATGNEQCLTLTSIREKGDFLNVENKIKNAEKKAIDILVKGFFIETRGSGIPSAEAKYRICKSFKVPDVYRELENKIQAGELDMEICHFMKKTMVQSNLKPVNDALQTYLKTKKSQKFAKKSQKSQICKNKTDFQ